MSDKTNAKPLLAFFGLDRANAAATLKWVFTVMALPVGLLVVMSFGLSFFVKIPFIGHLAAVGGAALAAFLTLARVRATILSPTPEEAEEPPEEH